MLNQLRTKAKTTCQDPISSQHQARPCTNGALERLTKGARVGKTGRIPLPLPDPYATSPTLATLLEGDLSAQQTLQETLFDRITFSGGLWGARPQSGHFQMVGCVVFWLRVGAVGLQPGGDMQLALGYR
jgi:hypothetical protein